MENINELELRAYENSIIAKKELVFANELKKMAKQELKRAKIREISSLRDLEIAQIREELAKTNRKIVEKKSKSKELLKVPDIILKSENEFTTFNEKLAVLQKEIAGINKEIGKLERKIAEHRK